MLVSFLAIFGSFYLGDAKADPVTQYTTVSGKVYQLTADAPAAMQPAYQGPTGLIWGSLISNFSTTAAEAQSICQSMGARLPTVQDLLELRRDMSSDAAAEMIEEMTTSDGSISHRSRNRTYDVSHPALPDIGVSIWSLSFEYDVTKHKLSPLVFYGGQYACTTGGSMCDSDGFIWTDILPEYNPIKLARCVMTKENK